MLIVGGGCRALALARELRGDGHAVRITTRDAARVPEIAATGAEPVLGDPDRVGSLVYALDNVTILMWLLGTATGPNVAALHDTRFERMLEEVVDTTVRGVVYEAAGSVDAGALALGVEHLRAAQQASNIPAALLEADPRRPGEWLAPARRAIDSLLVEHPEPLR